MENLNSQLSEYAGRAVQENYSDFGQYLRNVNLSEIQHHIEKGKFALGDYYAETLWSGSPDKKNEDSYAVFPMGEGRTLFAVFDGASSQKKNKILNAMGMSGAFYISHLASFGFPRSLAYKNLCESNNLTAEDVMISMNRWIKERFDKVPGIDYFDIPSIPGMAAALLLVDVPNSVLTVAQVADTGIAVTKRNGEVEIITPNLNAVFDEETMEFVKMLAKKYGTNLAQIRKIPEAAEKIHIHLADSFRRKTNRVGGCGIMNGMPEMVKNKLYFSDKFALNDGVVSFMMYSDGAIQPYLDKDLSLSESARLFKEVITKGNNSSVFEVGRSILDNDPDFIRIPRLKHRDDSTVLVVEIDPGRINPFPLAE